MSSAVGRPGSVGSVASSPGSVNRPSAAKVGNFPPPFSGVKVTQAPGSAPTLTIPGSSAPRPSAESVASQSSDTSTGPISSGALGKLFPLSEQGGQESRPPCFISEAQLQRELKKESENLTGRVTLELRQHQEKLDKQIKEDLLNLKGEYTTIFAEMRKDMGIHRNLQAAVSDCEARLTELQSRLEFLAAANCSPADAPSPTADSLQLQLLRSELGDCRMEQQSKFADLEDLFEQHRAIAERQGQTLSHSEAAIADLRSDVQSLRDAHVAQAEGTMIPQDLRRELLEMQQGMSQAVQDLERRCSSDVSRCAEDFANLVEATKAALKADIQLELQKFQAKRNEDSGTRTVELSQAIDKLRGEMDLDRSQADVKLSRCETSGKDLQQQLENINRALGEKNARDISASQRDDEHTARIEALKRLLEQDQLDRAKEVATVSTRLEERLLTLETSCRNMSLNAEERPGMTIDPPKLTALAARLDVLESNTSAEKANTTNAADELVTLNARLDLLEVSCRDTVQIAAQRVEAALGLGAQPGAVSNSLAARILKLEKQLDDLVKGAAVDTSSPSATSPVSAVAAERTASRRAALTSKLEAMLPESNLGSDKAKDLATGLAQCIGEMDAELWMELASHIQTLGAELRTELLSEVDKRMESSQLQSTIPVEVKRLLADVGTRVGKMEFSMVEVAGHRLVNVEGEVKKLSLLVAALMDRSEKVNTSALLAQAEELTTGTLGTMTASTAGAISDSSASHRPPLSDDGLDRDLSGAGSEYGSGAAQLPTPERPLIMDSSPGESPQAHSVDPEGIDETSWLGKLQKMLTEGKSKQKQTAEASLTQSIPQRLSSHPPAESRALSNNPQDKMVHEYATSQVSSSSDPDRNQRSQSEQTRGQGDLLSDGLKESLQDLVSAVHRTLGENKEIGGSLSLPPPNTGGSMTLGVGGSISGGTGGRSMKRSYSPVSRKASEPMNNTFPSARGERASSQIDVRTSLTRTASPTSPALGMRGVMAQGNPRMEMTDSAALGGRSSSLGSSQQTGVQPGGAPSLASSQQRHSLDYKKQASYPAPREASYPAPQTQSQFTPANLSKTLPASSAPRMATPMDQRSANVGLRQMQVQYPQARRGPSP